jgi:hypothetical protein
MCQLEVGRMFFSRERRKGQRQTAGSIILLVWQKGRAFLLRVALA